MLVRVERNPAGPRLYVRGVRLHHWHWGSAMVLFGVRWIWKDRQDIPGWPKFDPEIGVTTNGDDW